MSPNRAIIIVEDDPIAVQLLVKGLESSEYDVVAAVSDGPAAIDQTARLKPDLALVDINLLGDMNGLEAAQILHSRYDVGVIFLTGQIDDELVNKALDSEPFGYLVKPVDAHQVRAALKVAAGRRDLERRLRLTEKRLRLAVEAAEAGAWEWDFIAGRMELDDRTMAMFHTNPSLFNNDFASWRSLVHPDDIRRANKDAVDAILGGGIYESEYRIMGEGGWRTVRAKGMVTRDAQGQPLKMAGLVMDITEQKAAERRLRQQAVVKEAAAELSRALFDETGGAEKLAQLTLEQAKKLTGSPHGYVSFFESTDGEAISFVPEKALAGDCRVEGGFPKVTLHPRPDGAYPGLWGHSLNTRQGLIANRPPDHPSAAGLPEGHIPVNRFMSYPVVQADKLLGQIALANSDRDYTNDDLEAIAQLAYRYAEAIHLHRERIRRVELETKIQQIQRLEAIGTLAGGIAHDFNNILASIIGFTEIALFDELEPDHPAGDDLRQVLKSCQRAKDLVQQILTFSRRQDQMRRPLSLIPLLKESIKFLRSSMPATIDLQYLIAAEPDLVFADPAEIHQVIVNLGVNAIQALEDEKGVVRVELKAEEVTAARAELLDLTPGPYLELTVSDTGRGIPPEALDRIFEPYYSIHDQAGGSGLGLAVVHGIVTGLGGRIDVSSPPGRRTEFKVLLPSAPSPDKPDPAVRPRAGGRGEDVLVVDDEQDIIRVIKKSLEELGYRVAPAADGLEAWRIYQADPAGFRLIITDQTMPRLTGLELIERIRETDQKIRAILVSGHTDAIDPARLRGLDVTAVLHKPLTRADLGVVVRQALDDG